MKKPKYDLANALQDLRPNSLWIIHDFDDIDSIEWLDENQTKPSNEEIINQLSVGTETNVNQKLYAYNRSKEYPPIEEQLDMIYHFGIDAWKSAITKIKEKYPKP